MPEQHLPKNLEACLMALGSQQHGGKLAEHCSHMQTKKGPGQIAQAWLDARLKPQIATGQTHSQTRRHRVCPYHYANTVPAFFAINRQ
ncbi:hypothetical protein VI06_08185 [Aquitalea magnusonii]|nr:hypothetical protein VI06_08185 [Aquitalea magnusonii]